MANLITLLNYDIKNPVGAGSSPNEKLFMWGLLSQCKFKSVLEIGVSRGHMTLWLAYGQSEHKGTLTSVDNWSRAHGGEATSESYALKRLQDNKLDKYVTFVKSESYEYLAKCNKEQFDFIWIDGDHSYEGALRDIELAMALNPKMIGVHDVTQQYSGPRNACRTVEENTGKDGTWVLGHRGIWLYNV